MKARRTRWLLGLVLVLGACARAAAPPLHAPIHERSQSFRERVPEPGAPTRVDYPVPQTAALENGMAVWVVRRPAAVASVSVIVRHGQSSVPEGKSGLAAVTARMLTESTEQRSSAELAEAVESLGTTLQHDAGRDYSRVGLTVLASDVARALELLAEVVRQPRFAPAELERVRAEWIDGLLAERQSPQRLAALVALRGLLGPVHGAPVGGGVSDVRKLGVDDVRSFHRRAWAPEAAALVVVGDVDLASVRAAAERAFGGWSSDAGGALPEPAASPAAPPRPRVLLVDRPGSVQSAIFAAHRLPPRAAPGFEARLLLSSVIGGLFTSRLNQNLREKNAYTYGARSQAIATRHWGAFVVSTSVERSVTAPALRELIGELSAAADPAAGRPITTDELGRARADLSSSLGAHLEDVGRVAGDMTAAFHLGLGPDYHARFPALVSAVPHAEVQREAHERLRPHELVIVIVGDAESVEPGVSELGPTVERAPETLLD